MDNNQILRNCFVIICCHLTKVSSQINKCLIFEPNELSITLSTIYLHQLPAAHRRVSSCASLIAASIMCTGCHQPKYIG